MHKPLSLRSLKARTVRNKFNIIIGLIILLLLLSLSNVLSSIKITSGIRAYVGGEGLWSKGQKEAVTSLLAYKSSRDEADYNRYLTFIKIPLGDKQARLELNKPHPNEAVVRQGFIQGGNNPADVNDLIFLYKYFRRVSYMSAAVSVWSEGDQKIATLIGLGDQMHALVTSLNSASTPAQQARVNDELDTVRSQIYDVDSELTTLENKFSATLGNGSRNISRILLEETLFTTGLLGLLTIIVALLVARAIIRLDKLKSEFVSLASHQLRTPLTAINWYIEALAGETKKNPTIGPQQQQYIEELNEAGRRMAMLISDLLEVSSLELQTYKPSLSAIDVSSVLNTVVKDLQAQIASRKITLHIKVDQNLPKLALDKLFLTTILQNLLSNSVKYTPSGGSISVSITYERRRMLIRVQDTGIGIPKEQQSEIFTKLFRADNAKQVDSNGTGLGLYIVKTIVNRLGGDIWFESAENKGTIFNVKLPVSVDAG